MALISCPECGREKVSDNAAACPDCGFGIKEYFEKQKEREERSYAFELERKAKMEAMLAGYKSPLMKCPVCGSYKTKKISSLGRAVSVGMLGLASGKIGKNYQCDKCKHTW